MEAHPAGFEHHAGLEPRRKDQSIADENIGMVQGVQRQVFTSFSGGKDSTVLLDLARQVCPDIPAVYVDTGLEYPELRDFVKTKDNVIWLRPRYPFTHDS